MAKEEELRGGFNNKINNCQLKHILGTFSSGTEIK